MTDLPARYVAEAETMADTVRAWVQAHPYACLVFNAPDPDKMGLPPSEAAKVKALIASRPGETMGIICGLNDAIPWWGGNEDTRALLKAMDAASGFRATYTQARAALASVFDSESKA